jgi:magnesium chelatase accessory protein
MTAAPRPARAAPTIRFVQTGAVRWCVTERGEGPVVLLVHGTGSSAESFDGLAMRFSDEGFRVIAPDLPGHARTRVGRRFVPDLPSMAAALGELLEALEVTPVVMVGHSAGVAVLVRMVLDELVPAPALLVGLAPALRPLPGVAGFGFPLAARVLASSGLTARLVAATADDAAVARMIEQTGSRLPPAALGHYHQVARQPTHVEGVLAMLAHWNLDGLEAELPRLSTRCLFLAGANDAAIHPDAQRAVVRRAPNASFACLDEVGHLLHEERPAAVFNVLAPALASLRRPSSPVTLA